MADPHLHIDINATVGRFAEATKRAAETIRAMYRVKVRWQPTPAQARAIKRKRKARSRALRMSLPAHRR